jgi:sugar O-acyltransferase (sialic acid O-acetyltransferase NeuD family)
MKVSIIGDGGLSREIRAYLAESGIEYTVYISDELYNEKKHEPAGVLKLSTLNTEEAPVLIAIANPEAKLNISEQLPQNTTYFTFKHPTASVYSDSIGQGTVIGPNAVITTNVKIGMHCLINCNVVIGHDTLIGDYCTINPAAFIAGNCAIGNGTFIGGGVCVREDIIISNANTVGLGAVVVKDLLGYNETYVGAPAKPLSKPGTSHAP